MTKIGDILATDHDRSIVYPGEDSQGEALARIDSPEHGQGPQMFLASILAHTWPSWQMTPAGEAFEWPKKPTHVRDITSDHVGEGFGICGAIKRSKEQKPSR